MLFKSYDSAKGRIFGKILGFAGQSGDGASFISFLVDANDAKNAVGGFLFLLDDYPDFWSELPPVRSRFEETIKSLSEWCEERKIKYEIFLGNGIPRAWRTSRAYIDRHRGDGEQLELPF